MTKVATLVEKETCLETKTGSSRSARETVKRKVQELFFLLYIYVLVPVYCLTLLFHWVREPHSGIQEDILLHIQLFTPFPSHNSIP